MLAGKDLLGNDRGQAAQHVGAAVDDHLLQGKENVLVQLSLASGCRSKSCCPNP